MFLPDQLQIAPTPDALMSPPGLAGVIIDQIERSAPFVHRALSLNCALATIATAMGGQYRGPTGTTQALYCVGLAPADNGKSFYLDANCLLLAEAGLSARFSGCEFRSYLAFVNMLKRKPICLCTMKGIDLLLERHLPRPFAKKIRAAWDRNGSVLNLDGYECDTSGIPVHLSISSFVTTSQFLGAVSKGQLSLNTMNRILLLSSPQRVRWLPDVPCFSVSPTILEGLRQLSAVAQEPRPRAIPWSDKQVKRDFYLFSDDTNRLARRDHHLPNLRGHTAQIALRLACIVAAGRDHESPSVTAADLAFGRELVISSTDAMLSVMRQLGRAP